MKRVLIDIRSLTPEFSGVGRYIHELLRHLPRQKRFHSLQFFLLTHRSTLIPDFISGHFDLIESPYEVTRHPQNEWWSSLALKSVIRQHGIDVFHCPAFQVPWLRPPCALVTTIHDLGVIMTPDFFPRKFRYLLTFNMFMASRHSSAIITMSRTVRQELIQHFNPACEVYPVAMGAFGSLQGDHPAAEIPHQDYMLVVGNVDPRKGHAELFRAYDLMRTQNPSLKTRLIVIGREIWGYAEPRRMKDTLSFGHDILFLDFVDDASLISYYHHARLIVLPSQYEGFGLPLIEALKYNRNILCNDIPVFRELAPAYILFTRFADTTQASAGMAEALSQKSPPPAPLPDTFSWDACAEKTLEIYMNALPKERPA